MPSTHADLDLSGEWCKTVSGETFVLANDGDDDKIVIFGIENALQHLSEAETFFVDGTFSICRVLPIYFLSGFHHPHHEIQPGVSNDLCLAA